MKKYVLAIDQGTTGSRAFIFNENGRIVTSAYQEFKQYYPKPGWVEHDAEEIWASVVYVIKEALKKAKIRPRQIISIGITNQRETTVIWDRKTSKPVHKAIVWQCRRTSTICQSSKFKKLRSGIRKKTGLVLDPYFSGTKIKWLLDNVKGLRERAKKGEVCFGTIDSWLIWKLTGGRSHVTDMTNASRTLVFNIRNLKWDESLLKSFGIPHILMPRVLESGANFGRTHKSSGLFDGIPITAVMGDQQAALYGQGCFDAGSMKNTYGTGCFLVLNTGKKLYYSKDGLLSTVACDDRGKPVYAMEGSIFIAGAVIQWLRDELKFFDNSKDCEKFVHGLKDTNGVYLVPAFAGLGAPYWDSEARGIITGLTRGANRNHITRAALEAIAYQTRDVFDAMQKSFKRKTNKLKVDGGACQNDFLMQFQADILNCTVERPSVVETTAQGAAYLAGVSVGLWSGRKQLARMLSKEKYFKPSMNARERKALYEGWLDAVNRAKQS